MLQSCSAMWMQSTWPPMTTSVTWSSQMSVKLLPESKVLRFFFLFLPFLDEAFVVLVPKLRSRAKRMMDNALSRTPSRASGGAMLPVATCLDARV